MTGPRINLGDPDVRDHAAELYAEIGNARKVATILGCSRQSVVRMLTAHGVQLRSTTRDNAKPIGEKASCAGCGIERSVNMSRGYAAYCLACITGDPALKSKTKCGTVDGHSRHRLFGQPPCKPCRGAVTDHAGAQDETPARKCSCGKKIRTTHDQCATCRRGLRPATKRPAALPAGPAAVIEWAKKPGGLLVAVKVYDPEPDIETEVAA